MKALLNLAVNAAIDPGLSGSPAGRPQRLPGWVLTVLDLGQAVALLLARLFVAQVFFMSGLVKLRDWSATLALFADYYQTPILPPTLAAYMGTGGEIVLPVLLALGLGGRFAAVGLFFVNLMAVVSLPAEDLSAAGLLGHQLWGVLLVVVALFGAGRLSVDALLTRSR